MRALEIFIWHKSTDLDDASTLEKQQKPAARLEHLYDRIDQKLEDTT